MTNLFTPDIHRAMAFYRDLIGFTQTYQYPSTGQPEHAEFRLGHFMLALSSVEAARTVSLPEPRPGNPVELVIWCDDVDAELSRLTARGTPVLVKPFEHVAGHRRASVEDPDGNWVTLVGEH
jgi:lactoylglutathione lyase